MMHTSTSHCNLERLRKAAARAISIVACAAALAAWVQAEDPIKSDVLSLQQAVDTALANNRSLEMAGLEIDKSRWQLAEFRTKRLPAFSSSVLASQLLNEISFTVKAGTFGDYPGTGPIPSHDAKITTPRRPTALRLEGGSD